VLEVLLPSTHAYKPRILCFFDFDGTLGGDSIDALLPVWDLDRDAWTERFLEPLGDDWDGILRRSRSLIEAGEACGRPLTEPLMREAGERLELFDGVMQLPRRLRETAREVHDAIEVECHILSSGHAEVIEGTGIMEAFDRLWASTLHFDEEGRALCAKRMVSHPEKALYIQAIVKGLAVEGDNTPEKAGEPLDPHEQFTRFDQVVYVGDGASDLQAFEFVAKHGGLTLALDDDDVFDHADQQSPAQRVDNLAKPTYDEGSEALESLRLAVRSAAARVALRARSKGE
jgi:phosphoglycolate phosphatase-like HAD superfamily hydrolase